MDEHDQPDEAWFEAWRTIHAPRADHRSRHLVRLEQAIASDARKRITTWIGAGAVAMAAMLFLFWSGIGRLDRRLDEARPDTASSYARVDGPPLENVRTAKPPPAGPSAPELPVGKDDASESSAEDAAGPNSDHEIEHAAFGPSNGSAPRRATRARPPAERLGDAPRSDAEAPTLSEEVRLLRSASQSLRAGDPGRALAILREHQVRFPSSSLEEEREAWTAVATCRMQAGQRGLEAASAFLGRYPHSLHASRVRRACGGP